jgi:hypothetical protein
MIKKKLAYMAADAYAAESIGYRVVGDVEAARVAAGDDQQAQLAAIEEYAIECSIAKVYGSEALGRCVDEGVQVFGGYGFMEEYPITRAYRDARINRIFEGTNEVNRLVTAGTLFRRTVKGSLPLMAAFPQIEAEVGSGKALDFATDETPAALRESVNLVERLKRAALYTIFKGAQKFMAEMEEEQEFLEYAANQLINVYAIDSAVARALMAVKQGGVDARTHELLAQVAVLRLLPETKAALENTIIHSFDGEERAQELAKVRAYVGDAETDIVPAQRELAGIVAEKGAYPL